jgi:NADPH:quinone reductase-like Zn-dependent oxidoreductase
VRGLAVAGRVEAVGAGVTRFKPGDEVYGIGRVSFAEFASTSESKLAPKPAEFTFEQAADVPIAATTALQAVRDKGALQAGQKALIIGTQATGVSSTSKTHLVRSLGADEVVDYTKDAVTAGEQRYDLIVDTSGNRPLARLRRMLTPNGTLVMVGGEGDGNWSGGLGRNLQAVVQSRGGQKRRRMIATEDAASLHTLNELFAAGQVTPVIDKTYPLSETVEAIGHLERRQTRGRLVIIV